MIGYIKGQLIWQEENNIIVETNDVGYQIEIPTVNLYKKNETVELYIHTYVKEDKLELYGFKTIEEKGLFLTLLSISGIGPKAAMNIISTLPYDSFLNAILTENVTVLKQISGIGPKTAQRLILELKSKVEKLAVKVDKDLGINKYDQELHDALLSLGYSNREIDKTLNEIQLDENASLEAKIKELLSYLAKER